MLKEMVFGSDAGVNVTKSTALTLSAVYAALNILGDTMNIPVAVYKNVDGDKEPVSESDRYEFQVYKLLHTSPNQVNTPSEYFKLMEVTRNIHGNAFNLIIRKNGLPVALRYVPPQNTEVSFDGVRLWYTFYQDDGSLLAKDVPPWDVIHVKAMSKDGIMGISPIDQAKESLSFGKATQVKGNEYFESGMLNKVFAVHPNQLKAQGEKNLKDVIDMKLKDKGASVLQEGIKIYPMSITNEQSQFLQSREFSVTEVSRWFNIPEFMLANQDPTYSNVEGFYSYFVTHNVRPRVRMYEQEFNWKLLGNHPEYFTEFNMDALVRADLRSQAEYFVRATGGNSWMTRNEVRKLKNLNKDTGERGDMFLEPLNAATEKERNEEQN